MTRREVLWSVRQTAIGLCAGALSCSLVSAAALRDAGNGCEVSGIPEVAQMSVSWTGDCIANRASGVGDIFAFGAGRLSYILRGEFQDGTLRRTIKTRECSATSCTDDAPVNLLRLHKQLAEAQATASQELKAGETRADPSAANASRTTPPSASASPVESREMRTPEVTYRGRFVVERASGAVSGVGVLEFLDGRRFDGRLLNGKFEGPGTYTWPDGMKYVGDWRNNLQHGQGTLEYPGGDVYTGQFVDGERTGTGSLRTRSGDIYEGQWFHGVRTGDGRATWANGQRYDGQWRNDQPNGHGTLNFPNGDTYVGDFADGARTGNGKMRHGNGDWYDGQWARGVRQGRGKACWVNGQCYEGQWQADQRSGAGYMRYQDGSTYDGEWTNDEATGRGDLVFATGDSYTGEVRAGLPHGKGIMRWGSGDRFEGEFKEGKPTANGEMIFQAEASADRTAAAAAQEAVPVVPPVPAVVNTPPTREAQCTTAYNAARDVAALRRFIDTYPNDECSRVGLARQKIAAWEERTRLAAKAADERAAAARAFIGARVAFKQDFPYCVAGTGPACQTVVYVYDVTAKIKEIDVQRRQARIEITSATSLGNERGAPQQLFTEHRAAAAAEFKARHVGKSVTRTLSDINVAF